MSHQVNFYLTPRDMAAVEERLRSLGSYLILCSRSATAEPRIVKTLDVEEGGQPWLYFHLVRPDDLPSVVMRPVPAQGYWTVDVIKSPVIELNRCFFDGHVLRRGRVYFVDSYYGADGMPIEKDESFRRWARSVLSATKKALARHGTDYIGSDARTWIESPGRQLVV